MRSCIRVLYLLCFAELFAASVMPSRIASAAPATAALHAASGARQPGPRQAGLREASTAQPATSQPAAASNPDALYAQREDLAKARQAADAWAQRLKAQPKDFEAAWKLARAYYWLGGHGPEASRRADLEAGVTSGQAAIAVDPKRPEGHFWMAASMGALAESYGMRAGIRYRKPIKAALEEVLRLDPGFQAGSADRALGRWYYKVPGLFGGSKEQSEAHLRKSLTYDQNSTASHFFLAETLIELNRKPEARAELQKVLEVPVDPDWAPEDREFKDKAKALLGTIGQ